MTWVAAIPTLPALAFAMLVPMPARVRNRMLWVPVSAMTASALLAIAAFVKVWPGGESFKPADIIHWTFGVVNGRAIDIGLRLDPIAAIMLVTVTIVGACVQVYSLGYMHRDNREGWYFAVLSLFTSAMLALVLADSLLLVFAMWEMMGLCSYLLIGFWYELDAPRKASQKAFLTTRIGDLGFLVALFVMYQQVHTWDLARVLSTASHWGPGAAALAGAGLLWAAMGKSAQIPLHVWLPDAMAGPTPASALIHAATMVAAGVFVLARMLPLLALTPWVLHAALVVGVITAIAAGLMAAVQHDIKKVLAYSTVSQLGLMFVAIGAGSQVAALFHLTTHAFFKSLLFLAAGVIIHAASTQDMREMGGLSRHMPVTTATATIGTLALAGLPPLAGFFSKDEILTVLLHEHHYGSFAAVLLASALTVFYMTRMWYRVFMGPEQNEHLHEGHRSMLIPMVLLSVFSALIGFATTNFAELLGHEGEFPGLPMWLLSFAVFGVGFGAGWWVYGRQKVVVNTRQWKQRLGVFYGMLAQRLYFDLVYETVFIRGYFILADIFWTFDRTVIDRIVNSAAAAWRALASVAWSFDGTAIDGTVNGIASGARRFSSTLRGLQTGRLQNYQRLVVGAVVILMLVFVAKGA